MDPKEKKEGDIATKDDHLIYMRPTVVCHDLKTFYGSLYIRCHARVLKRLFDRAREVEI